nr:hypothetical protein BaRGS_028719 [Batillaria attramentaria]
MESNWVKVREMVAERVLTRHLDDLEQQKQAVEMARMQHARDVDGLDMRSGQRLRAASLHVEASADDKSTLEEAQEVEERRPVTLISNTTSRVLPSRLMAQKEPKKNETDDNDDEKGDAKDEDDVVDTGTPREDDVWNQLDHWLGLDWIISTTRQF